MDRNNSQLLAVHQHNEAEAAAQVIARLAQGERVAYVSDAGTPAISDPGARLVAAVAAAGYRVMPLPGASSVTTLLSAAGVVGEGGFVFTGFLSSKATERQRAIETLSGEARAVVLLEAPHRIEALAQGLAMLGKRLITVGGSYVNQIYIRQSTECFSMRRDLTVKVFFKLSARLGQGVGCSDQLHARVLLKRGQHEGKGSA